MGKYGIQYFFQLHQPDLETYCMYETEQQNYYRNKSALYSAELRDET